MIERLLGSDCLECQTPMWAEGHIADDILLCHSCYHIDNLLKHGYVTADELNEQFEQFMQDRTPDDLDS